PVHPGPVVGHPHALDAALLDVHPDPPRPGVERVLEELLDHAGRALDHLAGGDLVGEVLREDVDGGHGSSVLSAIRATASKYVLVRARVSARAPRASGKKPPITSPIR